MGYHHRIVAGWHFGRESGQALVRYSTSICGGLCNAVVRG
jgi:hypothetical protein